MAGGFQFSRPILDTNRSKNQVRKYWLVILWWVHVSPRIDHTQFCQKWVACINRICSFIVDIVGFTTVYHMNNYPPVNEHRPWQIGVGRLVSLKNCDFQSQSVNLPEGKLHLTTLHQLATSLQASTSCSKLSWPHPSWLRGKLLIYPHEHGSKEELCFWELPELPRCTSNGLQSFWAWILLENDWLMRSLMLQDKIRQNNSATKHSCPLHAFTPLFSKCWYAKLW